MEQILTALLAEVPATASVDDAKVDDAKTALVDASLRELLALRDGAGIIGESIGPIQCPRS